MELLEQITQMKRRHPCEPFDWSKNSLSLDREFLHMIKRA